jgi:hypothetical protein
MKTRWKVARFAGLKVGGIGGRIQRRYAESGEETPSGGTSSRMGIIGGGDTPAVLRKSVEAVDCKRVVKHS